MALLLSRLARRWVQACVRAHLQQPGGEREQLILAGLGRRLGRGGGNSGGLQGTVAISATARATSLARDAYLSDDPAASSSARRRRGEDAGSTSLQDQSFRVNYSKGIVRRDDAMYLALGLGDRADADSLLAAGLSGNARLGAGAEHGGGHFCKLVDKACCAPVKA